MGSGATGSLLPAPEGLASSWFARGDEPPVAPSQNSAQKIKNQVSDEREWLAAQRKCAADDA
jgi:hypothetical protein